MTIRRQLMVRGVDRPLYKTFRAIGAPVVPPFHLTLSLTHKCGMRCKTCRTWDKDARRELSAKEYLLLFTSIKYRPLAVTLTGGEPLMRNDFLKIAVLVCEKLRPSAVFIETCGDMPVRLQHSVKTLVEKFPAVQFVVSLSLPGVQAGLDEMRGVESGAFEKFLRSVRAVKGVAGGNLSLNIHIPISRFNEHEARALVESAFMLYPDTISMTPVFGSEELDVTASDIIPSSEGMFSALEYYLEKTRRISGRGFSRVLWPAARRHARIAEANLRLMKQTVPCQAAHASIYISPAGSVLDCPVAAREIGDVRENQYDFIRILNAHNARYVRKQVATSGCFCAMDYSAFSHIILMPGMFTRMIGL